MSRKGSLSKGRAQGFCGSPSCSQENLALGRTSSSANGYGETIRGLLLAPAPRPAIYVGKLLGVVVLLLVTEVLVTPMVALLFHAPLFARPLLMALLLLLGTVGFSSVGTLFAAMLMRARTRDVMLPILLYPITVPVISCKAFSAPPR